MGKHRALPSMTVITFSRFLALASLLASALPAVTQAAEPSDSPFMPPVLNPVIVVAPREGWLDEEAAIGESKRPEWTSRRRFSTTRVYIQQEPWQVSLEQWWRVRSYDDRSARHLFIEELEIGLPHRMQLDLYYDWAHEGGETQNKDFAVELRWALADWDVIPLNPTLYGEYKFTDSGYGPDVYEVKLLLGDDFTPRVHWAANFVYEREIADGLANEFAITQGLSYTIIDQVLSAGVEMQFKYENTSGARQDGEHKFQIGPSFQWCPTRNTWINIVGLIGCTRDSPAFEGFLVLGHNFGTFAGAPSVTRPVSAPR